MKFSLSLLLVVGMGTGLGVAETSEAVLRRVADGVLAQTTRQLVDRTTGETFKNSGDLAPKPERR